MVNTMFGSSEQLLRHVNSCLAPQSKKGEPFWPFEFK